MFTLTDIDRACEVGTILEHSLPGVVLGGRLGGLSAGRSASGGAKGNAGNALNYWEEIWVGEIIARTMAGKCRRKEGEGEGCTSCANGGRSSGEDWFEWASRRRETDRVLFIQSFLIECYFCLLFNTLWIAVHQARGASKDN